jgi:DNA invertase Pin-like site-specific DNA recombinase
MIRHKFDLNAPFGVALYGRMSSDSQNERSPDQQFDAISHEIQKQKKPWNVVARYRDDAISGRLVKKRLGLMQLIQDIKTGKLKISAILVHTFERFGRADEIAELRKMLFRKYGVLVLTADSGFADPTSAGGEALTYVEQIRAKTVNPIKAADVFRGKKDLALQKRWPGGPPPFGFRLKYHMTEKDGKPEIDFATLEPNPRTAWIVQQLFELADSKGWGTGRLARYFNESPDIDAEHKPFYMSTVGYWLDQPIYYGELRWAKNATDIIDDVRVLQLNEIEDQIRVPDFCPPLVSRELWDRVQAVRNLRRTKTNRADPAAAAFRPLGAGRILTLPLTGLVRCGKCGLSMQPTCSGRTSKAGKKYVYYKCPRAHSSACSNSTTIREDLLRLAVVATLRRELFPPTPGEPVPSWLPSLFDQVRAELGALAKQSPDRSGGLTLELQQIDRQLLGWMQSLGKPDLPAALRHGLEQQYTEASQKRTGLEQQIHELEHTGKITEELLDVKAVLDRLNRLDQVLAGSNPTLTNVELSRHIDRIDVFGDGRMVLRGCRLGVLEDAVQLLSKSGSDEAPTVATDEPARVPSRARPKLRVDAGELDPSARELSQCSDVDRFAGLDESWFWNQTLEIPEPLFWFEEHAVDVAKVWSGDPTQWKMPKLAKHFGVSIPTARKALKAGLAELGIEYKGRTLAPRGTQDSRQIAEQAAALYLQEAPRLNIRQIAAMLKVNQVTISKALDHWYAKQGIKRPDGRATRTIRPHPATPCLDAAPTRLGKDGTDPEALSA